MHDPEFFEFVKNNISDLDALSHRYANYRIEITKNYLDELNSLIGQKIPNGYNKISGKLKSDQEQLWGWQRPINILIS